MRYLSEHIQLVVVGLSLTLNLLLASACSDNSPTSPPDTLPSNPRDLDGDGWSPPEDCLDAGYAWQTDDTECNESQRVFFEAPDSTGAKDFSVIDVDGELHIFYIENPGPLGVNGHTTTFGHASSRDLVTWTQHPSVSPSGGEGAFNSTAAWAPQVLRVGQLWYMFYTGVLIDGPVADNRQRIGLLTSTDLMTWAPVDRKCDGVDGAGCIMTCEATFTGWGSSLPWGSDCRDAFVLPIDGEWMMFVTVRLPDNQQVVAIARSKNLLDWELENFIPRTRGSIAESPTAVLDTSVSTPIWRMFWTTPAGIHQVVNRNLLDPDWSERAFVHAGFASELLLAGNDTHFFLYVDSQFRIQFERLVFEDDWLRFTRVVSPKCRVAASAIHPMDADTIDGIDTNCDGRVDQVASEFQDSIVGSSTRKPTLSMPRGRY